jgi:hypothetical protein
MRNEPATFKISVAHGKREPSTSMLVNETVRAMLPMTLPSDGGIEQDDVADSAPV